MRFKLILEHDVLSDDLIPINYQYPLSSSIYKILSKGDEEYAKFLHETGYGKGYKFFTFSDLKFKFKLENKDRMRLLGNNIELIVSFHMPEASKSFIEGLFRSEQIVIADKNSRAVFKVSSIQSLNSPFNESIPDNEIIQVLFKPISAVLIGVKNSNNTYDYLSPNKEGYIESLIYNWRGKILETYNIDNSQNIILLAEIEMFSNPFRSRLVHIKENTTSHTKIQGFLNFKIKLTAEKRFIELLYNTGVGLENSQGMGCVEVMNEKI